MTEKVNDSEDIAVESKLKKAMGNVLTASGGWNSSLISSDPFKYSQLGMTTANLLNEAMMKSRLDVENVISNSLMEQIEDKQRKLIEQATESVTKQVNRVADDIARDRARVIEEISRDRLKQQSDFKMLNFEADALNRRMGKEFQDKQRKLIEQATLSISKDLQDKIKKNVVLKRD